jgi:hypothetical protein
MAIEIIIIVNSEEINVKNGHYKNKQIGVKQHNRHEAYWQ